MKKILCVLLSLVIVFSLAVPAVSAKEKVTPVIVVGGVGCREFYADSGTENEVQVFPPSQVDFEYIITTSLIGIAKTVLTGNLDCLSTAVGQILENIFDKFMCDENGDSKYSNVSSVYYPLSIDNYEFDYEDDCPEVAIAGAAAKSVGAENTYFYNYDWRLDPCENADGLKSYIEAAKAKAGSEKVILIPCSMGGVQTLSYMSRFGYDDIEKIIFMSSAHKGLYFVSELFTGNLELSQKNTFKYVSDFVNLKDVNADNLFDLFCSFFGTTPVLKSAFGFINKFSVALSNDTLYASLRRVVGSWPGMWAFVRDEYYDDARAFMTTENTSEIFLNRIDNYHNTVGSKNDGILKRASESGVAICFCSHYGRGSIPVTPKANIEGDYLIEAPGTSNGATIANAGEYLPDGYVQQNECNGHNHLSPDNKIDASTCLFPDSTWFIKYAGHVGCNYGSEYSEMIDWLVSFEGQPTVFDNEKYPQFLQNDMSEMKLLPITERNDVSVKSGVKEFFKYIFGGKLWQS